MNYTYADLRNARQSYKALKRLINKDGFGNGFAVNKYLEAVRDIKYIKAKLNEVKI